MDDPIVVMGICGSYDLDSANGRMLELILRECESRCRNSGLGPWKEAFALVGAKVRGMIQTSKPSKKWLFLQMPMSYRVQNITEP